MLERTVTVVLNLSHQRSPTTTSNPSEMRLPPSGAHRTRRARFLQLHVVAVAVAPQFNKAALVGNSSAVLDWYFDVLLYDQETLVQMAVHCFQAFDIPRRFQISLARLLAFVRKVLSMYNDTPFHNAHHAFHVFQNCVMMVWAVPELAASMSLLDVFALLVAALCHDVDHVGRAVVLPQLSPPRNASGCSNSTRL